MGTRDDPYRKNKLEYSTGCIVRRYSSLSFITLASRERVAASTKRGTVLIWRRKRGALWNRC